MCVWRVRREMHPPHATHVAELKSLVKLVADATTTLAYTDGRASTGEVHTSSLKLKKYELAHTHTQQTSPREPEKDTA